MNYILIIMLAQIPTPEQQTEIQIQALRVSNAIHYIITQKSPRPNHPMYNYHSPERERLAESIAKAAIKHHIPPMLLVVFAFRENSFLPHKKGAIGELSIFQIVPKFLKPTKRYDPECTLRTIEGSAMCAAALLTQHRRTCGTLLGAVTKYASGSCKARTKRTARSSRSRLRMAGVLEGEF